MIRLDASPDVPVPFLLRAQIDELGCELPGAIRIESSADISKIVEPAGLAAYEGYVDGIEGGKLVGWMRDPARPTVHFSVELLDGERVIGAATANDFRADLLTEGVGDGRYGFALSLPISLLDGKNHTLNVRIATTAYVLPGGPLHIGMNHFTEVLSRLAELDASLHRERAALEELRTSMASLYEKEKIRLYERVDMMLVVFREQFEADFASIIHDLLPKSDNAQSAAPAITEIRASREHRKALQR